METIIQVTGLVKHFKDVKAVDGLSFSVKKGEIYGFLGQNGAGKSTTIRMLLSLVEPTQGSIQIFGKDLKGNRSSILQSTGAVIEKPDLYKYLTAYENLSIFARLTGRHINEAGIISRLDRVGLADRAHSKVKTFSQGMKQRLGIAVALVHDPELIILDEPANGLDPQGIAEIRHLILHLGKDLKKTVLVSSHLLSEVEQIADRLLILNKGKKIVEGTIAELLDPSRMQLELNTNNNAYARDLMNSFNGISKISKADDRLLIELHQQQIPHLIRHLVNHDVEILSVLSRHSLENYFLSLTSANNVGAIEN
jgi:ABC-type multidrug transport system ATPase subunit